MPDSLTFIFLIEDPNLGVHAHDLARDFDGRQSHPLIKSGTLQI